MKITTEEKQLYKLLDVVNKIFGKSNDKTVILGNKNVLYFYTLGYCGMFKSMFNEETLIDAYDFGAHFYELKQLPNKSFVLDRQKSDEDDFETQKERFHIMNFVESRIEGSRWILELYKDYESKIAKICSSTSKWIHDDDIKYLKMFSQFDVLESNDSLIFTSIEGDGISKTYFIMTGSIVLPDCDDSTQMKIDAYIKEEKVEEEPPEEFEDEDDPMA